jgi:hypothetical protein
VFLLDGLRIVTAGNVVDALLAARAWETLRDESGTVTTLP